MTPKPDLDAIERRLNAADEVHPPVTRWELRCAHGLTIASATTSPPRGWMVNGGRAQCCSECDDDEAEDFPAAPFVHSWTSQAYTEDKMSKEDVRVLLAEVRTARVDGARAMREAILRVERWSAGGVQAILDLDPAAVVGVATTVPDETLLPSPPPPENAHTAPAGGSSSEVRRG